MSKDPYIDAKAEVESNIAKVGDLLASFRRLQSGGGGAGGSGAALPETVEELQTTLDLLELDLADLDECVRVVETHGDRWGLPEGEVRARRGFVDRMERDVETLRKLVQQAVASGTRPAGASKGRQMERYRDDVEAQAGNDHDEAERWEREEQQLLMRRQDDTLGVISNTLSTIHSQAGLIGQEVNEHSVMLDDLSGRVDTTESRLARVSRSMKDFIEKNEDTKSSWCIAILIIILIILLVLVILV